MLLSSSPEVSRANVSVGERFYGATSTGPKDQPSRRRQRLLQERQAMAVGGLIASEYMMPKYARYRTGGLVAVAARPHALFDPFADLDVLAAH
jgi:hypothetical protein